MVPLLSSLAVLAVEASGADDPFGDLLELCVASVGLRAEARRFLKGGVWGVGEDPDLDFRAAEEAAVPAASFEADAAAAAAAAEASPVAANDAMSDRSSSSSACDSAEDDLLGPRSCVGTHLPGAVHQSSTTTTNPTSFPSNPGESSRTGLCEGVRMARTPITALH